MVSLDANPERPGSPPMAAAAPPNGQAKLTLARIRRVSPAILTVVFIATAWELFVVLTDQPTYLFPSLREVIGVAITRAPDTFLPAAWATLQAIFAGFGFGLLAGFSVALLIFYSRVARASLLPLAVASQTLPLIAVAPILIVWFGFGILPKIVIIGVITFFPIVVNTVAGLDAVDNDHVRLMRSLGASAPQVFRYLRAQAAAPYVFVGIKNGATLSVIAALVAEWVGATEGLGPVILEATAGMQTPVVFAAIMYLAAMGLGMFGLASLAERVCIPWHRAKRN